MNILEKEIEELLFEALTEDPEIVSKRGLKHNYEFEHLRQQDLGNYGRPDVIGYSIHPRDKGERIITVSVFELKKEQININTLLQASRYCTGIQEYISKHNLVNTRVVTNIFLIGKSIDDSTDFVFLLNQMSNVRAYTFKLDIYEGLKFNRENGYFINKNGFKNTNISFSDLRTLNENHYIRYTERLAQLDAGMF